MSGNVAVKTTLVSNNIEISASIVPSDNTSNNPTGDHNQFDHAEPLAISIINYCNGLDDNCSSLSVN